MELGRPFYAYNIQFWTKDLCENDIILFISTFYSNFMAKGIYHGAEMFLYMKKRLTQVFPILD